MDDFIQDMWHGPGHLRFYLQPLLAVVLGLRDGINDAKAGRPPYALSLLTQTQEQDRFRKLLKRLLIPLCIAIVMDLTFQFIIRGTVRPLASLVYAAVFVVVPYILARAMSNRAASHRPKGALKV